MRIVLGGWRVSVDQLAWLESCPDERQKSRRDAGVTEEQADP